MEFLTFEYLLNKNLHLSNINNKKYNFMVHKVINKNCYIVNLIYIITYLYKLYKIFYILNKKNINVTFVNMLIFSNSNLIKYLLLFSNNNYFGSNWIKGLITNREFLRYIFILCLWFIKIRKFLIFYDNKLYDRLFKIYKKFNNINNNLKYSSFFKFVFFFNLDYNVTAVNECFYTNRYIIGLCSLNYNNPLIDFYMYYNCINEVSINTIIEFILISYINSNANN